MALPVLVPASRRPTPVPIKSHDIELDKDLERVVHLNLRGALTNQAWRRKHMPLDHTARNYDYEHA